MKRPVSQASRSRRLRGVTTPRVRLLLLCTVALLSLSHVRAETPRGSTFTLDIPDVGLIDQDRRQVRFYRDLLQGKVVVMNFIFTSCTTVCTPMGATFGALQSHLDGAPEVRLISVSIDPTIDTPAKLKQWSDQFRRGERWTLLTGRKGDVDRLLKSLGVYSADRLTHPAVMLVGNEPTHRWTRASGLLPPAQIRSIIDSIRTIPTSSGKAK